MKCSLEQRTLLISDKCPLSNELLNEVKVRGHP